MYKVGEGVKKFIVIQGVFVCIFIFIILNITLTKTNDGITNKYLFYQIATSSMEGNESNYDIKSIYTSDVIVVKKNISNDFYSNLEIGDVITFEMNTGEYLGCVITHRIIDIEYDGNNFYITTKGDNSKGIEILNSSKDIVYGQVVVVSSVLGSVFNILTNIFFLCSVIILPCLYLIIKEINKIRKEIKGRVC